MGNVIDSNSLCLTRFYLVLNFGEKHCRLVINDAQFGLIKGDRQASCIDFRGHRVKEQIQRAFIESYELVNFGKLTMS